MPTKGQQILSALETLLDGALTGVTVEVNSVLPESIPSAGLVILRDGSPEADDDLAGGARNVWYAQSIEVELYVEHASAATRDTLFDTLLLNVGAALESDLTLGGLAAGLFYTRPDADLEPVEGAADIKSALLPVRVEYETATPLA